MPKSVVAADPERLADLLDDWEIHLRARNVSRSTIASYVSVATRFVRFLDSKALPTSASVIKRETSNSTSPNSLTRSSGGGGNRPR